MLGGEGRVQRCTIEVLFPARIIGYVIADRVTVDPVFTEL